MRKVFADTGYWIALLDIKDANHQRARSLSAQMGTMHIFTTELVLVEVLSFFSAAAASLRRNAFQLAVEVRSNPMVTVIPLSSGQFDAALLLYGAMHDKQWSPTDCASFEVMKQRKITDALSHDKHFEQAGFVALLREGN